MSRIERTIHVTDISKKIYSCKNEADFLNTWYEYFKGFLLKRGHSNEGVKDLFINYLSTGTSPAWRSDFTDFKESFAFNMRHFDNVDYRALFNFHRMVINQFNDFDAFTNAL